MKILGFCLFRCQFEIFFNVKIAINSSEKPTGQQICSLLTFFNIPIYKVCRKFDKRCIKTLKIGKLWVFGHFRFQFEIFFIHKTAILSSGKPTGQQSSAMLRVFNILIHVVYHKFDKNYLETFQIKIFLEFLSFWGNFSFEKPHLSPHGRLMDKEFVPCLTFSTF